MTQQRSFLRMLTPRGLRDTLRTWRNVQVERQLDPMGPTPRTGTYVAREDVRIQITAEMNDELWGWMAGRGWREIDLATDRRRYRAAMPSAVEELAFAETEAARERLERHILESAQMSTLELKRKPAARRVAS